MYPKLKESLCEAIFEAGEHEVKTKKGQKTNRVEHKN